jgi:cephalosporin hydroxylase
MEGRGTRTRMMLNGRTHGILEHGHNLLRATGLTQLGKRLLFPVVNNLFSIELMQKTGNFKSTKWLNTPIMQNILDLWTIQETISEVKPELLIETGTNQGGSALFYANLFDLMGIGRVITVDIEKMHDISHPRIDFIVGKSIAETTLERVTESVHSVNGPVMVILDSDHSYKTVIGELNAYAPFVTKGSFMLVQDGIRDTLPVLRQNYPPGPLPAIREFLASHKEFEVDRERCERFPISHHPEGWLRRMG